MARIAFFIVLSPSIILTGMVRAADDREQPAVNVNAVVTLLNLVINADEDTARRCIETLRRHLQTGQVAEAEVESLRDRLGERMQSIINDADHPLRFDALLLSAAWKDADSLDALRKVFAFPSAEVGRRLDALDALVAARDERVLDTIEDALQDADHNSAEFRGQVLTALGGLDRPDVGQVVLSQFDTFEPEVRSRALELLTQRPAWTRPLLAAIAAEEIDKGLLNVNQLRRIATFDDEELQEQFHKLYGAIREGRDPQREQLVGRMRDFLNQTPGDPHRGIAAFKKLCGQCHKIYGEGADVGPDITRNGRNDWNQLLSNVFDPSLVIGPGYQARQLVTEDGRVLTGLAVEESEQRVVLKVQGGKLETIPRDQIDVYQVSPLSMMPEQIETQLTPQEIADLMSFLALDKHPDDPDASYLPGAPRFESAGD